MAAREADASDAIRERLIALLRSRSPDIEDALIARLRSSELWTGLDAESIARLRPAAVETVAGIAAAVERGEWSPALSPAMVALIQSQARRGASLEEVLRGFSLGANVFFDFIAEELGDLPQAEGALRYAVSWLSRNNDQLMNAFAAVFRKEVERVNRSPSRYLAERVQGLLAGGSGDYADLGYRLDACHLGVIALGARAELECQALAESLGCDLLAVPRGGDTLWAWLGSPRPIELDRLRQLVDSRASLSVAAGEPRTGLEGWRLSHREAQAALEVAQLLPCGLTRYSDVALVADALRNEATGKALIDRYLEPWSRQRDGERLRATVRTYLDSDCNAASTASALGVNRHTVQRRLRKVGEAIGEPLSARRTELDVALRLEQLTAGVPEDGPPPRSGS